ncbi:Nif11-like leader peptide family natural product precursor [Salibacterium sp. K-3]
MANDDLQLFMEKVKKEEELWQSFQEAASKGQKELVDFAKEQGYERTEKDLESYKKEDKEMSDELSLEQLKSISAGAAEAPAQSPVSPRPEEKYREPRSRAPRI